MIFILLLFGENGMKNVTTTTVLSVIYSEVKVKDSKSKRLWTKSNATIHCHNCLHNVLAYASLSLIQ